MKFIPILFSTPMVVAILEGCKTMTRRVIKSRTGMFQVAKANYEPNANFFYHDTEVFELDENESQGKHIFCPYGQVGDVLWVRETFNVNTIPTGWTYNYKAANDTFNHPEWEKWKPNIFMPKAACRIFLEITDIRVERLNDISEQDAISEGVEIDHVSALGTFYKSYQYKDAIPFFQAKFSFKTLWEKINGKESWSLNEWVWVISFKRIDKPENFN